MTIVSKTTETRSWVNPYIDRIGSKPAYLLPFERKMKPDAIDPALTAHARATIDARRSEFQRCYVEVGSGSGRHLIERAAADRQSLYVGFELRYKRAFRTAEKAEQAGLNNLLVLRTDARQLSALFPPASLHGVYVNFPDPWSRKRRWIKHRLLNHDFFLALSTLLTADGFLSYKTDHAEYFDVTAAAIEESRLFCLKFVTKDLYKSPHFAGNVATEFENLFISQNLPICMLRAEKF